MKRGDVQRNGSLMDRQRGDAGSPVGTVSTVSRVPFRNIRPHFHLQHSRVPVRIPMSTRSGSGVAPLGHMRPLDASGRTRTAPGFSLIELLFALGIASVLAALAMPVSNQYVRWAKADSATEATLRVITGARDRAIAERRNIELTFVMPNILRLERENIDASGNTTSKTTELEVMLDNGQQFLKFTGVPDTPDAFGNSSAVTFGGTAPYMFASDGTLVDSSGDPVNGTILTGTPNQKETARAVTIFGASGLIRSWKWRGSSWAK